MGQVPTNYSRIGEVHKGDDSFWYFAIAITSSVMDYSDAAQSQYYHSAR